MASVSVRYIVHDVEAAIRFYTELLGFTELMHPNPYFAMLSRGDLRLVLSRPSERPGGGQSLPDGSVPEPGGWNRFQLQVDDLAAVVERLRDAGARFRSDLIEGVGVKQVIVEDPSGNPVELDEPMMPEARLDETV
jgi:catechol 2,3-dioxygenase-like lactoylglutathione lyase family enzyme